MYILKFIERNTPAIITLLFGYQIIQICNHYEKKWKLDRDYLKLLSSIPIYFMYMGFYYYYNGYNNRKVLQRLSHMKLSGKC